ncbi:MAG: 4Fe-4S dicluster domain-containing protein [Planctomycetaceae bacterium]|jgi:iron only hydrogenase large subunit-like protein/uncharacterized Fe-S cluster-containing protein|nr:4Fe-4S dicluster domain-containing protein [Planctomycetaceae bacterium]
MSTTNPTKSGSHSFPQVIFVNKAVCRDCYRCVRVCPVKAIQMRDGQASVVAERCISCGTCVRECPQSAKTFRKELETAKRLLESGERIACSLAPSFAGFYPERLRKRIPSVLRLLGFFHVAETAIGAFFTAKASARYIEQHEHDGRREPGIISACPACVDYILRFQPQWSRYIIPVVSPMIAHAKHIRRRFGNDTKVVFIGPCVAKKVEGQNTTGDGHIDAVLTFDEFNQWLEQEKIDLSGCEESDFDEQPRGAARYFPLEGGCVKTAGWTANLFDENVVTVTGFHDVRQALEASRPGQIIEPLFCPHGCTGGPAGGSKEPFYETRLNILDYAGNNSKNFGVTPQVAEQIVKEEILTAEDQAFLDTLTHYYDPPVMSKRKEITETQIREVFEKTGKSLPERQYDCGSCGYPSCRDMAIAIIEGFAEPEMCVPYFRQVAEQRIDRVIETSPNGIVTLDEHLNIVNMNPAFRQFFQCSNAVCGRPISYLMDPEPFERLLAEPDKKVEIIVNHESYHLVCHEVLYSLPVEKQFVGIFMNITTLQKNETQLDHLRQQTVRQARELLEQQVAMAETIAACLGENAARAESLLEKLMDQAEQK